MGFSFCFSFFEDFNLSENFREFSFCFLVNPLSYHCNCVSLYKSSHVQVFYRVNLSTILFFKLDISNNDSHFQCSPRRKAMYFYLRQLGFIS